MSAENHIKTTDLIISPEEAADDMRIRHAIAAQLDMNDNDIKGFHLLRRSIDARSRNIKIQLRVAVFTDTNTVLPEITPPPFSPLLQQTPIIVVGAGPAGLFAALKLIEQGYKPIVLERGKDVRSRRRDLAAITKEHLVNSNSNYCFGEGGAGTYSDGKLYTRSTKRGDIQTILETFVAHGASRDILIDAHPHIGTNKLPDIIVSMRQYILDAGGEVHFNTRLTDLVIKQGSIKAIHAEDVITHAQKEYISEHVILATGHSARDIFELLFRKNVLIESKPFALGVRIEHPQSFIDRTQYHCHSDHELEHKRKYLPPAAYSLVHQVEGRGVYSFCMCPGGIIAPCATAPGEIVTNGWSPSKRNNPFANSGMVVSIEENDAKHFSVEGALAMLRYQQEVEKKAWIAGGKTQVAPAQRALDFTQKKISSSLPDCSYTPGVISADLYEVLPREVSSRLQTALKEFGKKMKGYLSEEALLVATESRTSSPVRIPRDKITLQHPQVKGLYPCGEGAGYAGGIISAAIDGQKCAEAIVAVVSNQ